MTRKYAGGKTYTPRATLTDIEDTPRPISSRDHRELLAAAKALLTAVDEMTTLNFALGSDRPEREALRAVIARLEGGAQ